MRTTDEMTISLAARFRKAVDDKCYRVAARLARQIGAQSDTCGRCLMYHGRTKDGGACLLTGLETLGDGGCVFLESNIDRLRQIRSESGIQGNKMEGDAPVGATKGA